MSKKKSFIGVSTEGDPTSLAGNNRYTPYPQKTQDVSTDEYEHKAPSDVSFKDPPLEIQYNKELYPTVTPTEKLQESDDYGTKTYEQLDNDQVDAEDLPAKANRSGLPKAATWRFFMKEDKFGGIKTIDSLLKQADILPGGKGDDLDHDSIPKKEMEVGVDIESEHSPKRDIQEEIVADHEQEAIEMTGEPNYYKYLVDMEKQMKEDGKKESFVGIKELGTLIT